MVSFHSKRDIKDLLINSDFNCYGRQTELQFISYFVDIYNLPSEDPRYETMRGDIIQHTVNNDDWKEGWIFEDSRIGLLRDDQLFTEFLERIFHPDIREEENLWKPFLEEINLILKYDNLSLVATDSINGRSIYKIIANDHNKVVNQYSEEIKQKFSSEYISSQIDIMLANIDQKPNVAIGKAKELIESTAKTILDEMNVEYKKDMDFSLLAKKVIKELGLSANEQDEDTEAGKIAKQILGNLTGIPKNMAELRNAYGDGHGKTRSFKALPPRYARLAVGTATSIVYFLWDTYQERKADF